MRAFKYREQVTVSNVDGLWRVLDWTGGTVAHRVYWLGPVDDTAKAVASLLKYAMLGTHGDTMTPHSTHRQEQLP